MLVAIPTGIQVFAWLATLWTGRPVFHLPMLWVVGFLVIFVAGGLTGVMLALVPFDWQVHDTQFVVAHMHYVLVGGMLFPLMAGLYYWLPHVSGRMPSERLGRWGFWLVFIGFNLTFLVMHWTGLLGMPRRVYTYEAGLGWDMPNLVSSIGGFVMAIGIALTLADLALHFRFGRRAAVNPWHADTLEWATSMPPSPYNFVSLPPCATRHPLWEQPDLPTTIAEGRHALSTIDHGRRETWGTDPVSGRVREVIHLPGNTWLPLWVALALAVVCLALLTRAYPLAALAAAVCFVLVLRWSWENGAHPLAAPDARTGPDDPPLHSRTFDGPGLWGMGVTLLANGALFLSLVFGWFYLWTVSPLWQAPPRPPLAAWPLFADGVLLSATAWWFRRVVLGLRRSTIEALELKLWAAAALGLVQTLGLAWVIARAPLVATASAHDAVMLVMLLYVLGHCALAGVMTALQAWRVRRGYVGQLAPYEPAVVEQWWHYSVGVFWVSFLALVLFPATWSTP
jgi:cytochrome c oxidase subunit I+III